MTTVKGRAGWSIVLVVFGGLALGCSHIRTTGAASGPAAEKPQAKARTSARRAQSHDTPPADEGTNPSTPLATSPDGLLEPGAERRIQDKLVEEGLLEGDRTGELDGPTSQALRRFQQDHGLPATGAPDDETVRALGLDPREIFKSGS